MGIFDSLFKPDTSASTQYYNQAQKDVNIGQKEGIGSLKTGLEKSAPQYEQAANILGGFGQQFAPGITMYLNSLGLNGPEGNTAATSAYQHSPGFDYALELANQNALRNQAFTGNLNSGNTLQALSDRARELQNQDYGNWQDRLAGLINPSYQGLSGQAQTLRGLGDLISGNYENRANVQTGAAANKANLASQQGANMQSADNAANASFWSLVNGLLGAGAQVAGAGFGAPVTNLYAGSGATFPGIAMGA